MKRGISITVLILLVLAAGCGGQAKQVKVTYRSDPPGGTLYSADGECWGPAPKVLWYDLDEEAIQKGYLDAKGLTMRWPHGPEKSSGELLRVTINGTERQVVFTQPGFVAATGGK